MNMTATYVVLEPIVLGFLTPQDQMDAVVKRGQIIGWKDHSVYLLKDTDWHESNTIAGAINIWLETNRIKEL